MTSKRRSNKINFLSLSFVSKCISKAFLINIFVTFKKNILINRDVVGGKSHLVCFFVGWLSGNATHS